MSLVAGTRLGPYEIQSAIGAGGMGEVYKARDTRLDRTVAIKVLPPDSAADLERRARFEREAKTIAALSHPHICPLFDVGDHRGASIPRDGAPSGRYARRAARERAAAARAGAADRSGDRGGARGGPPPRRDPPRPQARERHPDEVGARSCSTSASRSCV